MPTAYKRKGTSSRATWTEEQLSEAVNAVNENRMGVNEAARTYNVPATTLRRRKAKNNMKKGCLGPSSTLGKEVENKLVAHILKLQKTGFAPTRTDVRSMAFKLAEQLGINHRFNKETGLAGFPWLCLFLKRNPRLSVRKSEAVSINRSLGMNKNDVKNYFQILEQVLTKNDLMCKPGHIFNMDETGLQLNNRPGHVIAKKGSKNIASVSSGEKGETITVIACCNAEGVFIPPTCVIKGTNENKAYADGMPPGSKIYMSPKSAYVNNDIFFKWLKDQFVPRKPIGKIILLLDGHTSHCSNVEMLEYCLEHDIILLCLPSHTTQFLQPLDRCFFKSFKMNYYAACNLFIKNNPGRKITRLQFGNLLSEGWNKSATVNNAISAFKSTGLVPFNPSAIPEEAFLTDYRPLQIEVASVEPQSLQETLSKTQQITSEKTQEVQDDQQPCCSWQNVAPPSPYVSRDSKTKEVPEENPTPGKMLDGISPVPVVSTPVDSVRRRSKQLAENLTDRETINEKRNKAIKRTKGNKTNKRTEMAEKPKTEMAKKPKAAMKHSSKRTKNWSSSDEDDDGNISFRDSSDDLGDPEENCTGCGEVYSQTTKADDWVKCMNCLHWFHDSCSKFLNFCHSCGVVICKTK